MTRLTASRLPPSERREQLLQVATEHFSEHGYSNSSMIQIAKDAKVTRALLYHYFPSKSALLEAVILRQANELLSSTSPNPTLSPYENIHNAIGRYIDFQSQTSSIAMALHPAVTVIPKSVQNTISSHHEIHTNRLIRYLNHVDTPLLRSALLSWLSFVAEMTRQANQQQSIERDEVISLCIKVLEGIVGPLPSGNSAKPTTIG